VELQLRLHVYPVLGDRPIGGIRPTEIQGLVRRLSLELAPSTLAVVYGRVVAVYRAAVRDRVVASSPCVDVRLPRTPTKAVSEVLEPEQVLALADAVPPRYRALVISGAGLGLRPGELFGLAVDRLEFLRRTVRVDQQMVRVRGEGVRLGPLKTAASYRTIPLPDVVGQAIAGHLQTWPAHPQLGLVFTNERDAPIQQYPFSTMFEKARSIRSLPEWTTPHDLRHFYASTLIRSGASIKVIQTRLGHGSAKITLDVYGHLFRDEDDRTRQAIEDALSPANMTQVSAEQ
jgi:integrase